MHNDVLQIRPGRVAALFCPSFETPDEAAVEEAILLAVCDARRAGVGLIQALLPPTASRESSLLKRCQFRDLGEVLYLQCPAEELAKARPVDSIDWPSFDQTPDAETKLARLIARTYHDSADCAAMHDTRSIDDILESHRSVGRFDPARWLLARQSGVDIGCLLLSEHTSGGEWEIVYMGLVPERRGQGLGLLSVRHAKWLADQSGAATLSAAVDAANSPAVSTYRKSGFEIRQRHRLMVRCL